MDRDQLDLAVELLRDVGDYAEDDTVDQALAADRPLGRFVDYVLDDSGARPAGPYATWSPSSRSWKGSWNRGCAARRLTAPRR